MGLFDLFSRESATVRRRKACQTKLTNMYYQKIDRLAAADDAARLVRDGDLEAVAVMLARFEHLAPNTTADREEKEYVLSLLVDLGERVVEPVQAYIRSTTRPVFWAFQVLFRLWPAERADAFLVEVLDATDNGYIRDPEKKIGLVRIASERRSTSVSRALLRFVDDHDETVRVTTADALLRDAVTDARVPLLERLASGDEDSLRLKQRIAEGFAELGWSVIERSAEVAGRLPFEFAASGDRIVRR